MFMRALESHPRSFAKAVTWRITGSLDTFFLSWLITGSLMFAGSIASAETVTKVFLYYLHERAWGALRWGNHVGSPDASTGSVARATSQ
jgi:uncharacterized membrane protein